MGKLTTTFLSLLVLAWSVTGCGQTDTKPSKEIIYVGTFSDEGLFVLEFDRESRTFSQIQQIEDFSGPNFQWIHPEGHALYSISSDPATDDEGDRNGSVAAYSIDRESGRLTFLNAQSTEGRGPAHVSLDPQGKFAFVSNYGGGNLSVYPIQSDGSLGAAVDVVQHEGSSINPRRQTRPYVHSIIPSPDGRFIYAVDLGTDYVAIYEVDRETGKLSPAEQPFLDLEPGSGPRHFTFHPSGDFAYTVDELSSTVTANAVNKQTGALDPVQRITMLPEDFDGTSSAADIHISPDGKFLYASNRGHDSLAIYRIDQSTGRLELVGHEPTRGGHPRNFAIDKFGEFVFVANRDNDNVVLFERDAETGLLTYTGVEATVPRAVCVTQYLIY